MKAKEYLLDSQKNNVIQFSQLKLYLPEDHDPLQRQISLQHEPEEDNTQLEIKVTINTNLVLMKYLKLQKASYKDKNIIT